MILWLALLSLLEAVSVCAWLGYAYDWIWTPDKGSWLTWIGVWASFMALNELGYWSMHGELKRSVKDDMDAVRDAKRELNEGRDSEVNAARALMKSAENERSAANSAKDAAIERAEVMEGQLADAIRLRDNCQNEIFVLKNLARIGGEKLGMDLIATGDSATPWRYVKKEVPPDPKA